MGRSLKGVNVDLEPLLDSMGKGFQVVECDGLCGEVLGVSGVGGLWDWGHVDCVWWIEGLDGVDVL
ncbi:hypothetical protein PFJ87_05g02030 [Encephalitozoon hellem]|uniref:Uncharacterized protein n=1 Tax=Encephalitozoon hellem TaxID=27973 RepID=A0ABY8CHR7_ENCHE|nr:hypothetical protein PFJ87_01g02180 [Encephalitozoon hellem]WEL37971.1 hypothetical protein PFJ87_02g00070 [Encephalitozoon hellem]WEL38732.1 hypothetical protein PFJ87_05g02030 [Encephalitozoon hellem]